MRTRIGIGCTLLASAGVGAFAASGFGDGGEGARPVSAQTVDTHVVAGPSAGAPALGKGASLFKVIYKASNTVSIPSGTTLWNLGVCPKGGAVLSSWHLRNGAVKAGIAAGGSTPTSGVRRVDYVTTNSLGSPANGRLGIICIK